MASPFADWQNFYVIVGSAGAALTGLQFVSMALISDMPSSQVEPEAGAAFATPSIIHFGTVLFLAAVMVMPWRGATGAAIILGAAGLMGSIYIVVSARTLLRQKAYQPVAEDWLFRVVLPLAAYVSFAICAGFVYAAIRPALFGVAGAVLMLLFIGIHNAWDNVTYIVFAKKRAERN